MIPVCSANGMNSTGSTDLGSGDATGSGLRSRSLPGVDIDMRLVIKRELIAGNRCG